MDIERQEDQLGTRAEQTRQGYRQIAPWAQPGNAVGRHLQRLDYPLAICFDSGAQDAEGSRSRPRPPTPLAPGGAIRQHRRPLSRSRTLLPATLYSCCLFDHRYQSQNSYEKSPSATDSLTAPTGLPCDIRVRNSRLIRGSRVLVRIASTTRAPLSTSRQRLEMSSTTLSS